MSYNSETIVEPKCPKCGGHMWNNIATKKNPKAPDFKCRDRNCDGVIWPEREGATRMPQPAVKPLATSGKAPYSSGGPLPYETESETGAPPAASPMPRLDALFNLYDACFAHAHSLAQRTLGNDASHEGVSAMAATIFIAAK